MPPALSWLVIKRMAGLKSNFIVVNLLALTLLLYGCTAQNSSVPGLLISGLGQNISDAAPIGTTVKGIIECGAGYTSHELYDIRVTVTEVLRGDTARNLIETANASSDSISVDTHEYLLAHVRFEYLARGMPGDCCHSLSWTQFIAFSQDGQEYEETSVVPPTPQLKGRACAGNIFEGWVVFRVSKSDKKPLMTFNAGIGGEEAVEHGGDIWFQLYD